MALNELEYLTVQGLASREGVTRKTVYAWLAEGVAPEMEKFHGQYFFPVSGLTSWTKPRRGRRAR